MEYELTRKWPFNDLCTPYVNVKDNEHMMRGKTNTETKKKSIIFID
jgi:hypothetical protein